MADNTKYGKYILTELKKKFSSPYETEVRPEDQTEVLLLDSDVIKGAFVVDTVWFWPDRALREEPDVRPHKHDYDEVLAVFGSDPKNPNDLGGEMEAVIGDEKHIVTKSCLIFLPKGVQHGPFRWNKMTRPVFHFAIQLSSTYK
jgi:hypothetical protein